MTPPQQRPVGAPLFTAPPADEPATATLGATSAGPDGLPGQPGRRRLLPVEHTAMFLSPPAEDDIPAPRPARHVPSSDRLVFSQPERQG
ncbi:hypothetical protein [Kitasatospora sp. McL0602]|uniref:hypothetical protein n=1 Tax=Kitasatospora sp. McL0602 TaxID=3439530 RepID=UPI003F887F85